MGSVRFKSESSKSLVKTEIFAIKKFSLIYQAIRIAKKLPCATGTIGAVPV